VVSSMRAEDIYRYRAGFGEGGFLRLASGVRYTSGEYDYMQTTTPVSLATLSTGALPSTHGVVSDHWFDYVDNRRIDLIVDRSVAGFGYTGMDGRFSPANLLAPTLGDALFAASADSRTVTVALEPSSAIVFGGQQGVAYWMEPSRIMWSSSTHYMLNLPAWVEDYNRTRINASLLSDSWPLLRRPSVYVNRRRAVVELPAAKRNEQPAIKTVGITAAVTPYTGYDRLRYTPAGNAAVLGFAKQLLTKYALGADAVPDVLNIVLDAPRFIAECYGPESLEAEDMYYRLDEELAEFLTYLFAQIKPEETLVVLTSDHGTSPSFDAAPKAAGRINLLQSEVIVNGFLNARHGQGDWVTSVHDRSIWLNRDMIYNKGLNLADVQEEVAAFVMQFRGVSHALSSAAMRSSYFGNGYGAKMQNGFYPRRSGDVVLNLMPGWTEESDSRRSDSGSMYGYDTRVPLLFYGWALPQRVVTRRTPMTSVAPTVAAVLG
ncbi:MAG: alkaline phosphatase family protein, partial [Alistipes sp.]|nr:alkaline phosphatase family protein [Alistipes sp.]